LRFFTPQGLKIATMGVTFGVEAEEETKGPLFHAIFHPHRCNDKGIGYRISKTEIFTEI